MTISKGNKQLLIATFAFVIFLLITQSALLSHAAK